LRAPGVCDIRHSSVVFSFFSGTGHFRPEKAEGASPRLRRQTNRQVPHLILRRPDNVRTGLKKKGSYQASFAPPHLGQTPSGGFQKLAQSSCMAEGRFAGRVWWLCRCEGMVIPDCGLRIAYCGMTNAEWKRHASRHRVV